jgi:hypothetical protein
MTIPPGNDRRHFLGQLAGGAAALAGFSFAPPVFAEEASTPLVKGEWDDSWTAKLEGKKFKTVFDAPQVNSALALHQADATIAGYRDVVGMDPKDLGLVVVIRHRAIPMAFNDTIWEKYDVGTTFKLNDPATGEPAKRNPFLHVAKEDRKGLVGHDQSLQRLYEQGVIFLGCNNAAMGWAFMLAKKSGEKPDDVKALLKANVIPGMTLLPTGIFAVVRAGNVGCSYMPAWYKLDEG